jgi:hypothetical protein
VNRTEVNNGITVPEAVVSYREQRQAGKAGEEGAYRDQAEGAAEVQDFGQGRPHVLTPRGDGRQMPITKAAKSATLEAKK